MKQLLVIEGILIPFTESAEAEPKPKKIHNNIRLLLTYGYRPEKNAKGQNTGKWYYQDDETETYEFMDAVAMLKADIQFLEERGWKAVFEFGLAFDRLKGWDNEALCYRQVSTEDAKMLFE